MAATKTVSRKRMHTDKLTRLAKNRRTAQEKAAEAQAKLYAAMAAAHADPVGRLTYEELMAATGLGRMRVADILREQREGREPATADE